MIKKMLSIEKSAFSTRIYILGFKFSIKRKYKANNKIYSIPIEKNRIFFETFSSTYSCNPKYITEEILKQHLPYELIWGVKKGVDKSQFPKNVTIVEQGSDEYIRKIASSKIIVRNDRSMCDLECGLIKKQGQKYIQTWHGSLGIKKTGIDINKANGKSIYSHEIDAKTIDYLTSNSDFTDELFKNIFFNNGEILKIGHPRNDIFFKETNSVKTRIFEKYRIPLDAKTIMYAPTFRDKSTDLSIYSLEMKQLKNALDDRFGGHWVILTRLHPKLKNLKEQFMNKELDYVFDVTDYSDIQELLVSVDSVITDYSSCIYDFMLTRKPGFIFATDIERYNTSRGFYYPLESTPFPISKNINELVNNIQNFNYENYIKDVDKFLDGKGCIDNGTASEKVVGLIQNIIESDK